MRSMEFKRLFTQREAESTLPLVRQIVADILETARRIRELGEDDGDLPRLQAELEEHLRELEEHGVLLQGLELLGRPGRLPRRDRR